jgi:hypothetical protein
MVICMDRPVRVVAMSILFAGDAVRMVSRAAHAIVA